MCLQIFAIASLGRVICDLAFIVTFFSSNDSSSPVKFFFLFICVCISKKCVVLCSKLHVAWSDSDASAAGVDDAVILATTGLNEEELKLL